jgi:hypothetical protein
LLERELILNKSTILLAQFPRELNKCQKVGLVASCYQQSIVQTEVFQAIPKLTENFHCTYRCVTKQEEWHLLLERLEFDQVTSSDVNSLPFPRAELRETALVIGRKVVNECHPAGSRVGVIDCQTHRNDKEKVKCIIKDLNSGLQIAVVMLVLSGTYSLSDDAEQLLAGTFVIMSLDEFRQKNLLSASPDSEVGIMYYFDPKLVIENKVLDVMLEVISHRRNSFDDDDSDSNSEDSYDGPGTSRSPAVPQLSTEQKNFVHGLTNFPGLGPNVLYCPCSAAMKDWREEAQCNGEHG